MKSLMISLISLVSIVFSFAAYAHVVTYYTIIALPPTHNESNVKVCVLDNKTQLLAIIHHDIKDHLIDEDINQNIITERYQPGLNKVIESFRCVIDAMRLNLQKIPALVIDNKYVFYGVTDLDESLDDFNEVTP